MDGQETRLCFLHLGGPASIVPLFRPDVKSTRWVFKPTKNDDDGRQTPWCFSLEGQQAFYSLATKKDLDRGPKIRHRQGQSHHRPRLLR